MPAPTPQQQAAIDAQGDVLVMAGAGAGKTSTLVQRLLDRLLNGVPRLSLDRVLVVTFTEAAASEMRHRLSVALEQIAVVHDESEPSGRAAHAREQLARLETARVSTLHAFCLRLVRDHFHELDLDPQFSVQDAAQSAVMRQQVLGDVLREAYQDETEAAEPVRAFLRRYAPEGDRSLRALILRLHDHARTLPEPDRWLEGQRARHENPEPDEWREFLHRSLMEWCTAWGTRVADVLAAEAEHPFALRARAALEALDTCLSGFYSTADLHAALAVVAGAGDTKGLKKGQLTEQKRALKALFDEASEVAGLVCASPSDASDPLRTDWNLVCDDVLALLALVHRFTVRVASARRAAAVVDFADLEQFALALLWDARADSPTALARSWRDRLDLVFVDEYQDINGAQDRLIACLSREGAAANRFFVGDVKQSIYRFRRADPRIFQGYARRWRESAHRCVIPLAENFRSHERILGFVNAWFARLMMPEVGGVAYDQDAQLLYGAPEARPALRRDPEGRVEVLFLSSSESDSGGEGMDDAGESEDATELDREEVQAAAVAVRLRQWHDEPLMLHDAGGSGGERAVAWRDMVVLHPSPRPVAERWARQFSRHGVPLEARRAGFFEATEVSDLVNLARLLDNPVQDHALLAVLRSPLVGMSVDELAIVRMADRRAPLWDGLVRLARGERLRGVPDEGAEEIEWRNLVEGARARASDFVDAYRRWRRLAREGALSLCLERALAETMFESWLRAQPRAESRLANVRRLLTLSRQFDQFLRHGLFRFLQFLDAQHASDEETDSAPASGADSVRLMSVHQSKGLEFPVVVVAGLGRRFNLADVRSDWLIDPEWGVAGPVLSADATRSHASVARWGAVQRLRREMAGEQVRLLYVACTRAVERLVLMGEVSPSMLEQWSQPSLGEPTARDLVAASSPVHWLGRCMASLTSRADWVQDGAGRGTWVDWQILKPTDEEVAGTPSAAAERAIDEMPIEGLDALRLRLGSSYSWPDAVREPGKVAVTALAKRVAMTDDTSVSTRQPTWRVPSTERSAALSEEAVARGAAHHLFCEWVDLGRSATQVELEMEVRRMVERGILDAEQAASLDVAALAGFWGSSLGARVRAEAECVERELPFTMRLGAEEFRLLGGDGSPRHAPGDFQVVQGVVDLAVIRADEIWIVDFKTDRVSGAALEERIAKYGLQLRLYAHALNSIYRRPVTERWLWFFHARRLVAIEP